MFACSTGTQEFNLLSKYQRSGHALGVRVHRVMSFGGVIRYSDLGSANSLAIVDISQSRVLA